MATTETYALGVGDLYIMVSDEIPTDELLEVSANLVGSTSGGCTLTYKFDTYQVEDDSNAILDITKTKENVSFKGNILKWNLDTLAKLTASSEVITTDLLVDVLKIGSSSVSIKTVVVRFIHTLPTGKKLKATLIGKNTGGFELAFTKDKETIIPFEISALSQEDGTLVEIEIEK